MGPICGYVLGKVEASPLDHAVENPLHWLIIPAQPLTVCKTDQTDEIDLIDWIKTRFSPPLIQTYSQHLPLKLYR
jgi:hypothetical protein